MNNRTKYEENQRNHIQKVNQNQRHGNINLNTRQTNSSAYNKESIQRQNNSFTSVEIIKFKFLWNAYSDPFKGENFVDYDENNQLHLNKNYNLFIKFHEPIQIPLMKPLDEYGVDFSKKLQFLIKDGSKIRPIKILDLVKQDEKSNQNISPFLEQKEKFYWQSNLNPWNQKEKAEWKAYDIKDQKLLQIAYKTFSLDRRQKIVHLNDYYVDFEKNIQIHKFDKTKERPIKIKKEEEIITNKNEEFDINNIQNLPKKYNILQNNSIIENPNNYQKDKIGIYNQKFIEPNKYNNPLKIMNPIHNNVKLNYQDIPLEQNNFNYHPIVKPNTNDKNIQPKDNNKNQPKDNNKNQPKDNNKNQVSKFSKINFNIFSEFHCFLKIQENLNFFPSGYNFNYKLDILKEVLISEIKNFSKLYLVEKIDIIWLTNVNNYNDFFEAILNIYLFENILYSKINEYVRNIKIDELDILKHFYICLLGTFEYFSKCNNNNFNSFKQKDIIVFEYGNSDQTDLLLYKNNFLGNNVYIFNEFLCTYFNTNFLKKSKKRNYAYPLFWEIKIPQTLLKYEKNNFAFIIKDSLNPSLWIKNGAIVEIEKITVENENSKDQIYKISCILKCFSLSSYLSRFTSNSTNTNLNLYGNNLGNDDMSINALIEALKNNNYIEKLDLSFNRLGDNQLIITKLKELLEYNNIKKFIVTKNNLNEETMRYLENLKKLECLF